MRARQTAAAALLTLVVAALAPGLVACKGASCQSECERSAKLDCDKDGVPDNDVNCTSACADYATVNASSGCGKDFDAYTSCLAGIQDLCTGTGPCNPQLATWMGCVQTFCAANPGADGCVLPG